MKEISVTKDVNVKINIINIERSRDIPGGASIKLSTLVNGGVVQQGTPLSAPTAGIRSVCKQAVIKTGSTTTAVKVPTGEHHFKVGDFIGVKEAGKAYAITGITTDGTLDTLTVGTAIDAVTVGAFIYEMAAEAASNTSAFKNVPVCVAATAFTVDQSKVLEAIPAIVACSIRSGVIGSAYLAVLKNIDEVSY